MGGPPGTVFGYAMLMSPNKDETRTTRTTNKDNKQGNKETRKQGQQTRKQGQQTRTKLPGEMAARMHADRGFGVRVCLFLFSLLSYLTTHSTYIEVSTSKSLGVHIDGNLSWDCR